jgi:hypothetical protein
MWQAEQVTAQVGSTAASAGGKASHRPAARTANWGKA